MTEFIGRNYYSIELKHQICKEHVEQGIRLCELVRKHKLSCHTLIHSWLRQLGYLGDSHNGIQRSAYIGIANENTVAKSKTGKPVALSDAQKEIEFLKKELADAKILAEGYRRMIELAEAELKVPIRKKPNTR